MLQDNSSYIMYLLVLLALLPYHHALPDIVKPDNTLVQSGMAFITESSFWLSDSAWTISWEFRLDNTDELITAIQADVSRL